MQRRSLFSNYMSLPKQGRLETCPYVPQPYPLGWLAKKSSAISLNVRNLTPSWDIM